MRQFFAMALAFGLVTSVVTAPAQAFLQFAKEFEKKYIGDETTEVQSKIAVAYKAAKKCNTCHDPRKNADGVASKKNRNPYGQALAKLLTKDDKKDMEKIQKALATVEAESAEAGAETFGARLSQGLLPYEMPAE